MTTERETLIVCPRCSTTEDYYGVITPSEMKADGFELVDGAWSGLCPGCRDADVEASNLEYEAIARAASELGKIHRAGPLSQITIPPDEGFDHAGESRFGFWAVPGYNGAGVTGGSLMFARSAALIVDNLNNNRGTRLVVNINSTATQAIIHGAAA